MVAANKLLHLLEAFTTPWFLFSSPQNHHLAFFLLEVFNNIIQYQFDGEMFLIAGQLSRSQQNRLLIRHPPTPQVTSTWCTPSSESAASSTIWPTCRLTWCSSRKRYRGTRSQGFCGPYPYPRSPQLAPDRLYLQNLAPSKPAWRPLQVWSSLMCIIKVFILTWGII